MTTPADWQDNTIQPADWDKNNSQPADFSEVDGQPSSWAENPDYYDVLTYDDAGTDYDDPDTFYDGFDPAETNIFGSGSKKATYSPTDSPSKADWSN